MATKSEFYKLAHFLNFVLNKRLVYVQHTFVHVPYDTQGLKFKISFIENSRTSPDRTKVLNLPFSWR